MPLVAAALRPPTAPLRRPARAWWRWLRPRGRADLRRHRMTLSVEVNGDDVARMHIERLPHEMEVAVGVREPQLIELGRRRRIPVDGMTIHALAELIASCAWPAIARFREPAARPDPAAWAPSYSVSLLAVAAAATQLVADRPLSPGSMRARAASRHPTTAACTTCPVPVGRGHRHRGHRAPPVALVARRAGRTQLACWRLCRPRRAVLDR